MKVLAIPDIHLKCEMFDRAEKILESGQADFAIQLGDMFDDWDMQFAIAFYQKTAERAIEFHKKFPKTLWCMGNHDFGYYNPEYGRRETGHSKLMEDEMKRQLEKMRKAGVSQKIVHVVDNVIFSHAGVMKEWVERQKQLVKYPTDGFVGIGDMLRLANHASPDELWLENSPIWARPGRSQHGKGLWWPERYLQVVGHTPMEGATFENNLLSTDVFSTYSNGAPIGDCRFVIVDTEKQSWRCVNEDV